MLNYYICFLFRLSVFFFSFLTLTDHFVGKLSARVKKLVFPAATTEKEGFRKAVAVLVADQLSILFPPTCSHSTLVSTFQAS